MIRKSICEFCFGSFPFSPRLKLHARLQIAEMLMGGSLDHFFFGIPEDDIDRNVSHNRRTVFMLGHLTPSAECVHDFFAPRDETDLVRRRIIADGNRFGPVFGVDDSGIKVESGIERTMSR